MAVNKNFVVKNGLEVSTDLIFADASTNKVGIGSTIPSTELDIIGGIGATNINLTGVGTIPTIKGTTGIVSTVVAHNVQAGNLNVTGVSSIGSLGTLSELYISGVATVSTLDVIGSGNMRVGIITEAQGTNLNFAGISTLGVTTTTDLTAQKFNVSGISTINNLIVTPDSVGTGATIGGAVGVITYIGDGSQLTGLGIGIGSTGSNGLGAGGLVGYGFTQLNFIGLGVSDVLFNTSVGIATIWIAGGGGGSGNVSIGSEAPGSPSSGDLWYSTEYGRTFIWFDEDALGIGNTAVWVDSAPFNQGGLFVNKYGDNIYGAIGYTGGTTSQASIYFTGDPNTGLIQPAADHVNIVAGGTKSLEVNPSGISVVGVITGDGSGLTGVASTDNIITTTEAKLLGGVRMEGFTTSATMNVTGISTFRNDITLTGSQAGVTSIFFDASADSLKFNDKVYLTFGNGADLQLYHNGTGNYIDSKADLNRDIFIRASKDLYLGHGDGSGGYHTFLYAAENAGVNLKYDNVKRFETASDDKGGGVIVTGKVVGTAATIGTGVTINNTGIDIGVGGIGIVTAGTLVSGVATIGTGVTINNTGIDAGIGAGIVTAKEFYGDGSNLSGLSAGGGEFNTGISEYATYAVTTSMATAFTANASATHRTIIHSCRVTNISASEVTVSGQLYGTTAFAHTIPVPAGSAVELFKKPKVMVASTTLQLQCSANSALQAIISAERQENTLLSSAAVDLTSTSATDLFTLGANAVVESILCTNDDGTNDVKATVAWTDGSNSVQAYLSYEMIIPADATVELLENPLAMPSGHKIRVTANAADRLEVIAAYKAAS